jgi:hypothetical protein
MSTDSPTEQRKSRVPNAVAILFIFIVLIAGCFFALKFYDLVMVAMYVPEGASAISPIVNYLLAGIGFFFMLGWAAYNGMFHDIEKPKQTMLDTEHQLDGTSEPFALWKKK